MKLFNNAIVQERVKNFFIHAINHNRLAHAYIFYGQEGRGKEAFAFELAKALNCAHPEQRPCNECPSCVKINKRNHPDVRYVFPVPQKTKTEKITDILHKKAKNPYLGAELPGHKNISIETIRELKNESRYGGFEARRRVFIIDGAEYLSREAANSFLKLLEEPPEDLLIILITSDYHHLLDTIRSRCQPVYFPAFSDDQIKEIITRYDSSAENPDMLIHLAQGNVKKIFTMLHSDYDQRKEQVYRFIKAVAADDLLQVNEIIEQLTQRRDKNYIIEFLDLVVLWLQDAFRYLSTGRTDVFTNIDYQTPITKFAEYYAASDLGAVITLVLAVRDHIGWNAHPALTLMKLAIEMHEKLVVNESVKEAV